jgi:hypothetical protein
MLNSEWKQKIRIMLILPRLPRILRGNAYILLVINLKLLSDVFDNCVSVRRVNDENFHSLSFCLVRNDVTIIIVEKSVPTGKYQSVNILTKSPNK